MHEAIGPVLDHLLHVRGVDFACCHPSMLERRIGQRMAAAGCVDLVQYHERLLADPTELDALLDAVTIKFSRFFRDPLTFELLAERVLPDLVLNKLRRRDASLRVWSAGCAMGEEPYSVAILLREVLARENGAMSLHIFATDVDQRALNTAKEAVYRSESLENVRYGHVARHFDAEGEAFRLHDEIRGLVSFSIHDILDRRHRVPAESIFGNFDLVLCRNLLIYFNAESQIRIFERLHQALVPGGWLVLGEVEAPPPQYRSRFERVLDICPVYRKR